MANLDGPWKDVVEQLFPQMMVLLFPQVAKAIDWRVAPQFKDNELPKLEPEETDRGKGRRHLDRLVLVKLRKGGMRYLLIHIEIQNQYDKNFTARMFCYFYRLHDRNAYPVTSLAVLGDLSPDWRPDRYEQEGLGHSLCFKFQTVKLLDYEDQLDSLLASDNPFGLVIAAHLKTLRTKGDPEKRAHWKQQLFRLAIQKNMARADLRNLLRFLDWMLRLPAKLDKQVEEALNLEMKEANMAFKGGIHGTIHILAKEEGKIEGKVEGKQEGKQEILLTLLGIKYGEIPQRFVEMIKTATLEKLDAWASNLLLKNSLEETFA